MGQEVGSNTVIRGAAVWMLYVSVIAAVLALLGVASVYAGLRTLRAQMRQNTRRVLEHINTISEAVTRSRE